MTAPTKELEKLVVSHKPRHGGHAVLRWMASDVASIMTLGLAMLTGDFIPNDYVPEVIWI